MRADAYGVVGSKVRAGSGSGVRAARIRKSRLRGLALEALESRTLLATLPPVTTTSRTPVSTLSGNANTPSIAIDPNNPMKMVAVWVRNDPQNPLHVGTNGGPTPVYAQAAYSTDGGNSWSPLGGSLGNDAADPATPANVLPAITDVSVAFDAHDNFYILNEPRRNDYSSGELLLQRFSFVNATPAQTLTNRVITSWTTAQGAAFKPTLEVDANRGAYLDPNGTYQQSDPGADLLAGGGLYGAVYVAYQSAFNASAPATNSRIVLGASADGGQSFGFRTLSGGFNDEASAPSISVSQGRPADPSSGRPVAVPGGLVSVVWGDTGVQSNGRDRIMLSTGQLVVAPFSTAPNTPIGNASNATTPAQTSIPLAVNVANPGSFILSKLTVSVALTHADLKQISIQLVPPAGSNLPSIFLLNNAVDGNGAPIAGQGASAATLANLGVDAGGNAVGTLFEDAAAASIDGIIGGPSTVGSFRPDGGVLQSFAGARGSQLNGTWQLVVTDYRPDASPGAQAVKLFSLNLTGTTFGGESAIATSGVHGVVNGGVFPNSGAILATPTGFGPAPVIASDNTLGPYSPYGGRLYVAYTDRDTTTAGVPADATTIRLIYSDDGGQSWNGPVLVSDANAGTDGRSESGIAAGRPAFAPQLAVDPATGMVVASYFDTRDDAARARVATYVNTSIDGGRSWSAGAYANASKTAVDAITQKAVNLGPIPDNQSAGNTVSRDTTFGFGDHQGLAVYNGTIFPIWASNLNGGSDGNQNNGAVVGGLRIVVGRTQTAAGPRVVSSTFGPVGEPGDTLNNVRNTANGPKDGGPQAGSFLVTFDRPVDPASIDPNGGNFTFTFRDPNGNVSGLGSLGATVAPVTTNPGDPNNNGYFGYTTFRVSFTPQWKVGTYSYSIAPTAAYPINARIRYYNGAVLKASEGLDQAANGRAANNAWNVPGPATSDVVLPLIVPGPHVVATQVQNRNPSGPNGATDNEVLNNSASYIDVTFDRNVLASSFTPAAVVRILGPAGLILPTAAEPFTVTPLVGGVPTPAATAASVFRVGFPRQALSGTYSITLASTITDTLGNALDTNLNAGLYSLRGKNPYAVDVANLYSSTGAVAIPDAVPGPTPTPAVVTSTITVPDSFIVTGVTVKLDITYPNDPDLKVTLVGPDGVVVNGTIVSGSRAVLFQHVGAAGSANFSGTVFDDATSPQTPIAAGSAPFFGRYNPLNSLGVNFANGSLNAKGTWTLIVENSGSALGGASQLNSWSLTLLEKTPGTGLGEPVADQATAHFRIFNDAPSSLLASNQWTSVGPAPIVNPITGAQKTGQVGALAVDPSDPSGNTVFAGGATGGVWKTTNFLTNDPNGPTWIPLTDFGPTAGINVGTIAVFPRGADPTKSIVFVGLGNPDTGTKGYGFLRSMDGGATWELLDSLTNTGPYAGRDKTFSQNATVSYKIVVDPTPNGNNQEIVYAALGGSSATAGLWRSLDTGTTWQRVSNPSLGKATDVVLDPLSGLGVVGGNLQTVYASFPGSGVYSSPNQGQSWFPMPGTKGDPLIQDVNTGQPVSVNLGAPPTGTADGRILLAKPYLLNSNVPNNVNLIDQLYEGWLYALVTTASGFDGLYLTKDYGQNWTKIALPAVSNGFGLYPSNNETLASYGAGANGGAVSFAIDPTNPNVVYIGGGAGVNQPGFLRVDTTALFDPHNFVAYDNSRPDGGKLQVNTAGPVGLIDPVNYPSAYLIDPNTGFAIPRAYLNLIRDPSNPFAVNSTLHTFNVTGFSNTGANARVFTYYSNSYYNANDPLLNTSTGQHRLITYVDPQTGHARLILGDDQGVFTGVDDNGTMIGGVGTAPGPLGSRNGNLSITQFFYGAVQPSATNSSNNPMSVIFYGGVRNAGVPASGGNVVSAGNPGWSGQDGNSFAVATDPGGSGTVYRTVFQAGTNFFQVNGIGRTFGLTSGPNDPTWFGQQVYNNGETIFGNFAVNPVNGNQVIISSNNGTIYRTEDQGVNWFPISNPLGAYAPAVAFGAPDPKAPNGVGNLDNFLYAGTVDGHIYVTNVGGGSGGNGNQWIDISAGINNEPVQRIVANPTRGSHEAYAVTTRGVYHIGDSLGGQPWQRVTGNLFNITIPAYNQNPALAAQQASARLTALTALQVDWRYQIPNNPSNPAAGTHPVLYVSGNGGVYRSLDNGATWALFPNVADQAPDPAMAVAQQLQLADGGYLPNTRVADLSMAAGKVNPSSGRAVWQAGDPDILVASTYGRGQFMINLAPWIAPNTTPAAGDFVSFDTASLFMRRTNDNKEVTLNTSPVITGYSEQSAFGNTVNVALYDLTDPAHPKPVAAVAGTTQTDAAGRFKVTVDKYFAGKPSGVYTFGLQATDQTGATGNMTLFTFVYEQASAPAPLSVTLDPSTDSGTYNGDRYTNFNNADGKSPLFNVTGVLPGATVYLVRATQVNGTLGAFTVVGSAVNTGSTGSVQVADVNGGNGTIPDTPLNNPIDTAPPQQNQYLYTAYQVDVLNLQSPDFAPALPVIVDSTAPAPPTKVRLVSTTDSGTSNSDNYTNFNNAGGNAPLFDVSGVEPHATVKLYRDAIDPATGQPFGAPVLVNTLLDVTPTGPENTVRIADINGDGSRIPDSPVGSPANTAPPAGFAYIYTAIQVDLAGNPSTGSPTFGNRGAIVLDGTDSDLHGDAGGPGGANRNGWLYMQKVLEAIQPNVTNGQKILVALGAQSDAGGLGFAASAIDSAFLKSPLPGLGWSILYVNGTSNMDAFLKGLPAAATDDKAKPAGNVTLAQVGLLYITTANETFDDLTDADLTMLGAHGDDIKNYLNTGGGLYTQAETNQDPNVQGYAWLTAIFPGITYTSLGSGGEVPKNVQLTTQGQSIFPGLTPADLSTGPVHGFFGGTIPAALATVFTFDETAHSAGTVTLGLSSVGGVTFVSGNQVIIDSTPPAVPGLSLDPASDTGTYNNDKITRRNNSPSPGNAPVFNATNIEPNGIVKLFRAAYDPATGTYGTPVLVNVLTQGSTGGTVQIADVNLPSGGPIPDGRYRYTVQQIDLAGNALPAGSDLDVTVLATPPAAPAPFRLDPLYDTGTFNNDGVTRDNNGAFPAPQFDVYGVVPRATVQLFRNRVVNGVPTGPVLVATLTDVTPGAGGLVMIADTNNGGGAIPDGTYIYTAQQIDVAGNPSPISAAYTVTIDTTVPQPDPPSAPVLEASSDTGTFANDQVTRNNNGKPFAAPVFDAGAGGRPVEPGATVTLYRALVDPVTGLPGTPVVVNTLVNTAGGVVPIADINGNDSKIPDGKYVYTIRLTDLAGNVGSFSAGLTVVILATAPVTPAPFRLDPGSDTGVSNNDNITQIIKLAHPVFDAGSASGPGAVLKGATLNLWRVALDPVTGLPVGSPVIVHSIVNVAAGGLVKITDDDSLADGRYVYTIEQVDLAGNHSPVGGAITVTYDTAQPPITGAPVLDPASDTGAKGDNLTSDTSPIFDVPVTVTGFKVNSKLTLVRDGVIVAPASPDDLSYYNATTGTMKVRDPGPVPPGVHVYQVFLTDLAGNVGVYSAPLTIRIANDPPGTITLNADSDSGVKGDNVTNVTNPAFDVASVAPNSTLLLLRGVTVVASVPTGPGGTVTVRDPGPLSNGSYTYTCQVVDANGKTSPSGPSLTITVDGTAPVAPTGLKLDPASDTGAKGDNLTGATNPAFNASGAVAGATVELFRDGTKVASLLVASAGTVTVRDPGPVPNGAHLYTVRQVSAAGNPSTSSPALAVTIDATVPAAPAIVLDPASDSGVKGDNVTNVVAPVFDLANLLPGATVRLYRAGLSTPIATLTNVAGTTATVQDPGPLANGTYSYTVVQTNAAGTDSPASNPALQIRIDTTTQAGPLVPTLSLDPGSDTGVKGDGVTSARRPVIVGTADPGATVKVYDVTAGAVGTNKAVLVGTATADGAGKFQVALPTPLNNGLYKYAATATNASNQVSAATSPALQVRLITVDGDYNGDGRTELQLFRRTTTSYLQWFVNGYGTLANVGFGAGSLDVPLSGDFFGTGKTDPALYRPSTAQWFVQNPSNNYVGQLLVTFGWPNHDVPVVADYYGTGVSVPGVYRPETGEFFVLGTPTSKVVVAPQPGDVPVPADYDNTGKAEFAVFRAGWNATWFILRPSGDVAQVHFGGPGDVPVPGAYDAVPAFGATATSRNVEPAVWRESTGQFFILGPAGGRVYQFAPGDVPAPGDYDGLGVTEPAVYRPSTGQFFVYGPNDDPGKPPRLLGQFGDPSQVSIPALAPYKYRALKTGTVSAAGAPSVSAGLNFAASAAAMSAPTTPAPAKASAAPAAPAPVVAAPRVRPNQAAEAPKPPSASLVDEALGALVVDSLMKPDR